MEYLRQILGGPFEWLISLATYDRNRPIFFTNPEFLVFLAIFFAAILILRRYRTPVILAFSLWFYYKCSGPYIAVILFAGLFNYAAALRVSRAGGQAGRALALGAVGVNILLLALFKYTPYFTELLRYLTINASVVSALAFPVGLSFYTFSNISYILDVRKGVLQPERNPLNYMACITFFPIVQMGPIERAVKLLPQFARTPGLTREDVSEGLFLILSGALKKLVIGDYINLHLVTQVLGNPERNTGLENLAALVGYSMVIYCDFSGYTDMARGIARWMGFRISLNFDFPYRSKDIGEFWRRWHITLSGWLRDYLFMPLAFYLSRLMKQERLFGLRLLRTDVVIFTLASLVTFAVCGVWHGTGWNFLLWGAMHGAALSLHRVWHIGTKPVRQRMSPMARKFGSFFAWLLTFTFITTGWAFFRMRTPEESLAVLSQITQHFYLSGLWLFIQAYLPALAMLSLAFTLHFLPSAAYDRLRTLLSLQPWYLQACVAMVAMAAVIWFGSLGSPQPIYIRF